MTDPSTNAHHEIRSSKQKAHQSSAALFTAASTPIITGDLGRRDAIRPERRRAGPNREPSPRDIARCG